MIPLIAALLSCQEYQAGEPHRRIAPEAAFTLDGRVSFPGGGDVTTGGFAYDEFFDVGWGGGLTAELVYEMPYGLGLGGYLSVGFDSFEGDRVTDDFGDVVDPDGMDIFTVFVGGKAVQYLGDVVYWQGRIGFGAVHYSEVEADYVLGGLMSQGELFDQSTAAAFEVAGGLGFGERRWTAHVDLGFRVHGHPREGDGAPSFVDPEAMATFFIEAGLTVRF